MGFDVTDIEHAIRMTICVCDEPDYNMQLSLAEINGEVCQAMFNEPMPEDMFNMIDADGSGEISFDEALAFASIIEDMEGQGRSYFAISRTFSNNGK